MSPCKLDKTAMGSRFCMEDKSQSTPLKDSQRDIALVRFNSLGEKKKYPRCLHNSRLNQHLSGSECIGFFSRNYSSLEPKTQILLGAPKSKRTWEDETK